MKFKLLTLILGFLLTAQAQAWDQNKTTFIVTGTMQAEGNSVAVNAYQMFGGCDRYAQQLINGRWCLDKSSLNNTSNDSSIKGVYKISDIQDGYSPNTVIVFLYKFPSASACQTDTVGKPSLCYNIQ